MGLQPASNQRDIFRADRPPLNDLLPLHCPTMTKKGAVRPEKSIKKIPRIPMQLLERRNTASNLTAVSPLCHNENCWINPTCD
jgi:hypothetical protein